MLAGSRNAQWARSEAGFVRQWQDPKLAAELRAIGIEKPEQMGAMFIADADQLGVLVGDTPPLTDNHPKRLSNERHSPQLARIRYRPWMNAELTRERFRSSDFIRRAWPQAIRERSLAYFDLQGAINDVGMRRQFSMRDWIERLHAILTRSDLETLVLWQLGDTVDLHDAVDRLLEQGKPRYRYRRSLAIRAFAQRNYDLAARYLSRRPGKRFKSLASFYLRLYALCMAGKVSDAERAAADAQRWLPDDAQKRETFAWLNETSRGLSRSKSGTRFGPCRRVWPPSMPKTCPVIQPAASESRKATADATSAGSPMRETGILRRYSSRDAGSSDSIAAIGVFTMPGITELTRMPHSPSSSAPHWLSMLRPALDTQ
jgi:hypothetical protein